MHKIIILLSTVLSLTTSWATAQHQAQINTPQPGKPYLVFVVPTSLMATVRQNIHKAANRQQAAFLIIDGNQQSPETLKNVINAQLNSEQLISKQRVHLIIVGSYRMYQKFAVYTNDFFASQYFLQNSGFQSHTLVMPSSPFATTSIDALLDKLGSKYTWKFRIDNIEHTHVDLHQQSQLKRGLGFSMGRMYPNILHSNRYTPASLNQYSVDYYKNLNSHLQLGGVFKTGLLIPNPKKIIREQVQEQVDISSLLSGNLVVDINTEIKAHLYLDLTLMSKYVFFPRHRLRPYVGVGLSLASFSSTKVRVDTSLTINISSIREGLDREAMADKTDPLKLTTVGIPLAAGAYYDLNRGVLLHLSANYTQDLAFFGKYTASFNPLSFNLGLVLQLKVRQKKRYNYVRIK